MPLEQVPILAFTAPVFAACQQEPVPPSSPPRPANGASVEQAAVAKLSPRILVEPTAVYSNDVVVATVKWDASKSGATSDSMEIWVGPSDADTKLFSAGGATSETRTGPSSRSGPHFLLKNKQDGKVLGKAIVGGPTCQ